MGSPEEKEKRSFKRKRNFIARSLRDPGERKGAFSLRIQTPKTEKYKRQRINKNHIMKESDEDE